MNPVCLGVTGWYRSAGPSFPYWETVECVELWHAQCVTLNCFIISWSVMTNNRVCHRVRHWSDACRQHWLDDDHHTTSIISMINMSGKTTNLSTLINTSVNNQDNVNKNNNSKDIFFYNCFENIGKYFSKKYFFLDFCNKFVYQLLLYNSQLSLNCQQLDNDSWWQLGGAASPLMKRRVKCV